MLKVLFEKPPYETKTGANSTSEKEQEESFEPPPPLKTHMNQHPEFLLFMGMTV